MLIPKKMRMPIKKIVDNEIDFSLLLLKGSLLKAGVKAGMGSNSMSLLRVAFEGGIFFLANELLYVRTWL